MTPLKFHPLLRETLWGGERIAAFKQLSSENPYIGESWELSALPGAESVVCEGELEGLHLSEVMALKGEELLGKRLSERFGSEFPLLVKFIDARQDLSIQVHPNETMARRLHNAHGKSEMWYVIDAEPGSCLYCGFSEELTPESYDLAVAEGRIVEKVQRHEAHPGDLFFLPAGRIHSIGAGLLVAEIQESSDLTYRIFDFNRRDKVGKLRELHTELARQALDFRVEQEYRTPYIPALDQEVPLIDTPCFTSTLHELTRREERNLATHDSFEIVIVLGGEGTLTDHEGHTLSLRQGETVLVPASTPHITLTPSPTLKYLSCHIR